MITTKSAEGKILDFVPPEWDNIPMENAPESAPAGMRYFRAYFYLFDSPKWTMNLLLGAVCNLIPVLGGIVFAGYGYETLEAMHRRGKDDQYPEFDFNRFVKYLVRGCWPFIWQLIIGLPFAFIMWLAYMVLIMAFIGTADHEGPKPGVLVPVLILFVLMGLVLGVIVGAMGAPLVLRAGLSQELGFGEALPFMQDFLKRVGKEVVLAQLFLVGTAIVIMPIAYALCFLPALPAAVIIQMAHFHLLYQLYGLYLQRGGTAIPLQVKALPT